MATITPPLSGFDTNIGDGGGDYIFSGHTTNQCAWAMWWRDADGVYGPKDWGANLADMTEAQLDAELGDLTRRSKDYSTEAQELIDSGTLHQKRKRLQNFRGNYPTAVAWWNAPSKRWIFRADQNPTDFQAADHGGTDPDGWTVKMVLESASGHRITRG